jgi:hypothetical protein
MRSLHCLLKCVKDALDVSLGEQAVAIGAHGNDRCQKVNIARRHSLPGDSLDDLVELWPRTGSVCHPAASVRAYSMSGIDTTG